jgi:hypothetical protein
MWCKKMNRSGNIFFCLCAALLLAADMSRAQTNFFWSDNFETNAGRRWINNGIWSIGSPTIGPAINSAGYRTHSGANCATTGLKSNYPYNADARLVCINYNGASSFVVPSADESPRLRFWHWFNFVNALGYVEISTNAGSNWQQISLNYLNMSSSGVWSRPSIDLSSFAGQSVQIAFHFTSGGCCGTAPGWYIDDVEVVTNTPVFNNPEGFESGLGDWSVDFGTWEIGKPTSGPSHAHGGTNCAATVLAGNYGYNVESRLISPLFVVPSSHSPALRFWHWYNLVNAIGYVEIRIGTGSWSQISPNYLNANTGGVWTKVSLDLSSYAGQTVQAAFHFVSGGTCCGAGPGWYVDDISLVAAPVLTVPGTQTIYAGNTLTVTNYATLFTAGRQTFGLVSGPTNVVLNTTNGVLTWTPALAQTPSTNTISVKVTDNNVPPLSTTNSFIVRVLLLPALKIAASAQPTNGSFQLTFSTGSNTTWRIDASTNLSSWLPLLTNTVGPSGTIQFTDLLATNYPWRFYRAVLQ